LRPHGAPFANVEPFEKLVQLAEATTGSLSLSDVLLSAARIATELSSDSIARVWVVRRDSLVLSSEAGTEGSTHGGERTTLALGEGWAGHVGLTRQTLVVEDIASDSRVVNRDWMRKHGCVSAAIVPLIVRGELVGVLALMTRRRHKFTVEELRVLSAFGTHLAMAIYNARLYMEAEQRRLAAEMLADVGRLVSQSLDLEETAQRIADSVHSLFGAVAAVLYRWDAEIDNLVAIAVSGDWGPLLDHAVFPSSTGVIGLAVSERRPITTPDFLQDPRLNFTADLRSRVERAESRAVLAVPLIMKDEIIGALGIARRLGEAFDPGDLRLAEAFGHQAAIALENARRYEDQHALLDAFRNRRARLEALVAVNRELSTIQSVDSLLSRIATTCGKLLGTDSVGIRLREGDDLVLAFAAGGAKDVMATTRIKIGESLSGLVVAAGTPLLLRDPVHDARLLPAHREAMQRLGYRSLLAVPIKVGDRVAGVLSIQNRRWEGFSEEDVAIVTAFADQVGVALHNDHLYEQAQQAYRELTTTQDQLIQSQKMDAIGRLAGGIAHDFNNLLTVITGHTHLLLRQTPEGELHGGIERVALAADRAADLTRQLLAFSRKQVLQPTVVQMNTAVGRIAPMLQRVIGEDIELKTFLAPALANVKADATQLEQVIMNLAVNARDAMPRGGQLTLETADVVLDEPYVRDHAEFTAGSYVMLAVSDTGVGMDADTRRRLFEPFYTTKQPGKGTGLGLATVYGIVKQSGGHIWVYSEPGRGTTFKIYLPAVLDAVDSASKPVPSESPGGCETVMLVEDEDDVRDLVRRVLADNGYNVLEAARPADALELASHHAGAIDLLLTDVVMPQMSGSVLADLLTAVRKEMRVLFMSGYTDAAIVHHGVLDGGKAYIAKPFTPEKLGTAVRRVLDGVHDELTARTRTRQRDR
jgi:GAF domain-containing protein/ActR/RegA family two-component response regulator